MSKNDKKRVIIVGGVAGGASAAARLRRLDENLEIIMFERGGYISFANCGLPYYIGNSIKDREKLLVQTEEGMEQRFDIDIRVNSEVTSINRQLKEVEVFSDGKTYKERYDYLILSPGASPIIPKIPGIQREGIYVLRNMEDVDRIKASMTNRKISKAVVIGGGFVGVEMAENLKETGAKVTLVEAADQIMSPLDIEMARILEKHLREEGVELVLSDGVKEFEGSEAIEVVLNSGRKFKSDIVILAIGVRPEIKLAKEAGLEIGDRGGIKVDDHLRTSDEAIFAVGDAIEIKDFVNHSDALVPLAGPANKQGRIAADNICGRNSVFKGAQGTSIIKVFDLTGAGTGNNEKTLKRLGIPYLKSYTISNSHAGYYPGSLPMNIKLLFSPEDGTVLGAQIIGRDGVDKRIDVLATAIRHRLTVYDLEELELAYAPPYSSAKDPVNMAGFVAGNILREDVKVTQWDEVDELSSAEYYFVDVRSKLEYDSGHMEKFANIPVDELRDRIEELPKGKKIVVTCKVGLRGYIAYRILSQRGYEAYNLSGGYDTYLYAKQKNIEGASIKLNEEMTKIEKEEAVKASKGKTILIDACGLQCPGPIMRVYKEMEKINEGDILEIHVTDPAFASDIKAWCSRTGNSLLGIDKTKCDFIAYIKKGAEIQQTNKGSNKPAELPKGKSMVVFSGDLDKAIASFIIANGAAAMGRPVSMFFTFWGLNILRKTEKVNAKKNIIEKMFGIMMPRGSKKLGLSKMNMAGIGPKMIRGIMKHKNISSLEELIKEAMNNGVKITACSMSMDVMGIKPEELIDGIEIGGVAAYLGDAEESNVNLFI